MNEKANGDRAEQAPKGKVSTDVDLGAALKGSMEALHALLQGFVQVAQGFVGPEALRSYVAGLWLARVASSLDDAAAALGAAGQVPAGKAGELACYLERLEAEIQGSKFAWQTADLRQRLESALQALGAGELQPLTEAAGYFRAAANSAGPVPPVGPVDSTTS